MELRSRPTSSLAIILAKFIIELSLVTYPNACKIKASLNLLSLKNNLEQPF